MEIFYMTNPLQTAFHPTLLLLQMNWNKIKFFDLWNFPARLLQMLF
jgi:hypothetical protein